MLCYPLMSQWYLMLLELSVEEMWLNTHTVSALLGRTSLNYCNTWVASPCLASPQPVAQRRWLFPRQMVHTNSTASSGSPLLQTQIWLSHWPERRTEQEQPRRYCWHALTTVITPLAWLSFIAVCVCLSPSRRAAGVCLCSTERWVEMRMDDWRA